MCVTLDKFGYFPTVHMYCHCEESFEYAQDKLRDVAV